jgi:(1->4)-alpha-D-glucan 1-alpha-D-glucosylmutase
MLLPFSSANFRTPPVKEGPRLAPRIPLATYRLQFNAHFTFRQAERLVPYLRRLGVGALYASPVFQARPGSAHGYDILDYNALNPELGGDADFRRMATALRQAGLGLVLDIVPNHLCVDHEGNPWWNDVLRHGQASRYARMFDINWHPPQAELRDHVVLPILLAPREQVLRDGVFALLYARDEFWLRCGTRNLPTDPATWPLVLETVPGAVPGTGPADGSLSADGPAIAAPTARSLRELIGRLKQLPSRDDGHPEAASRRHAEFDAVRTQLAGLARADAALGACLSGLETAQARGAGHAAGLLARLLEAQVYRPMYWPEGLEVLNYRRYSDISDLAGVRQEHPDVFLATHELLLDLIGTGDVTGLRVDHPDGLLDPAGYFVRLQQGCALMESADSDSGQGLEAPHGPVQRAFYVVAEKILSGAEPLRRDWPVHGTTGYEVLHLVNGLFLQPAGERPLRESYAAFTGSREDFHAVLLRSKREVIATLFPGEHGRLTQRLHGILQRIPAAAALDRATLHRALGEVIAAFPVYTHYLRRMGPPAKPEAAFVEYAVAHARAANPDLPPETFAWIQSLLLLEESASLAAVSFPERQEFALRFRQMLSAVMGKGLEDTALYRYVPLLSLNEMGGDPAGFATAPDAFHERMAERRHHWPHGMSTTSTHDTKRSEDVRARLNVVSEIPEVWDAAVRRWWGMHQPLRRGVGSGVLRDLAPDANEAWLFYQTLLGTWPMDPAAGHPDLPARLQAFLRKALREAKIHTHWIAENRAYEEAVLAFAADVLDPRSSAAFLADFAGVHGQIALAGAYNALAQVLLKLTVPGVPDLYQGCELWDLSNVDPDNRRPVDYEYRAALLNEVESGLRGDRVALVARLRDAWPDGRIKLFVTRQALHFRYDLRQVMEQGSYQPLQVAGRRAAHAIAFARQHHEQRALTVVGRWFTALGVPQRHPIGQVWEDTHVLLRDADSVTYRDAFTGQTHTAGKAAGGWALPLADVFAQLPLALLERIS